MILLNFAFSKAVCDVCPVAAYAVEMQIIKTTHCHRIHAIKMLCDRMMLTILWTAHHMNNFILAEVGINDRLSKLINKQNLGCFGNTERREGILE